MEPSAEEKEAFCGAASKGRASRTYGLITLGDSRESLEAQYRSTKAHSVSPTQGGLRVNRDLWSIMRDDEKDSRTGISDEPQQVKSRRRAKYLAYSSKHEN
jgi:hypothetical protein